MTVTPSVSNLSQPVILGFDPGQQKCGLAIMGLDRSLYYQAVVPAQDVLDQLQELRQTFPISTIVMGDQTAAKRWQQTLASLPNLPRVTLVDERYSSLQARDRYWEMYPPKGLMKLIPQSLRTIPRPIDDIVAILLIERYLNRLTEDEFGSKA